MLKSTIGIRHERLAQLDALAGKLGLSRSETLEALILERIEAGEIPDTTPGFTIEAVDGLGFPAIKFWHDDGFGLAGVTPYVATHLADTLDASAGSGGSAKGKSLTMPGMTVKIARLGKTVFIAFEIDGTEIGKITTTPSIARDLARQVRNAIAQAKGL
jgi:hypothetical protein